MSEHLVEHLGDDAELYPLGVLEPAEASAVERHVAVCAVCAERVAQASSVAAYLASSLPEATPPARLERRLIAAARARAAVPFRLGWGARQFALAAALVLAVLGLGWQTLALRGRLASDDLALATLVNGHFNHVQMASQATPPLSAKILYARDGSWLYVIALHPGGALHAVGRTRAGAIDLGELRGSAQAVTLLARPGQRVSALTLRRDGRDVAAAPLIYADDR